MKRTRLPTLRSTRRSLAQSPTTTSLARVPTTPTTSYLRTLSTHSLPTYSKPPLTHFVTYSPLVRLPASPNSILSRHTISRSSSTSSFSASQSTAASVSTTTGSSDSFPLTTTPPTSSLTTATPSDDMNGATQGSARPKRKTSYNVNDDRPSKLPRAGANGQAGQGVDSHEDDIMLDDAEADGSAADDAASWGSDEDGVDYPDDDSTGAAPGVVEDGVDSNPSGNESSNGNIGASNGNGIFAPQTLRRRSSKKPQTSAAVGVPPVALLAAGNAETAEWQETIQRVVRNVVSIRFCAPCSFDTDPALTSEATGFVVDAERGYILTNRHVVGSGPFWGYCIFDNHEEVDAYPVYRDPVHDFGILKFDPKAIKYMPIESLSLCPDLAKVGVEIRVVGNDAGEKLSILSGVISRLDRNAPEYGEGYSDFNTSYLQASAAASGGSSGSPVVNIDGNAVALQAGGRADGASTDYFLPLDRPLRALRCLQEGKPITRGDIQCQFLLKPFDECRRLGLTPECEAQMRSAFPAETNMLVAEIVLPEGPSHGKIEEGDVLVKVNDELITQFIRLDDILDSSVDKEVKLELQRGGETLVVTVTVGDLHKITPDRFVSVAGGSFHNLSYQQARLYGVACKGVYICEAAGSFRFDSSDNGWIVQSIDHKKTPDLDAFIEAVKTIPDKSRVVVTYQHLRDLHTLNTSIIYVDRHWSSKIRLAVRNDATGLWDFSDLADALPPTPPVQRTASFIQMNHMPHPAVADLVRSFVHVNCYMPLKLDGFPKNRKWGMGLVIDAEKGLVVISRAIVPYDLCDITITIADSIVVEGKVVFMHPLQNYAIIQYDPSLVDAPVMSARLSTEELAQGAPTNFIGYNRISRVVHAATTVTEVFAVAIPANPGAPRYRAVNVDAITVDTNLSGQCGSGVLASDDGTVRALWLTYLGERSASTHRDEEYHLGLATPTLLPVIEQIQRGVVPKLRMLPVEFRSIQMSQARLMGVSEELIKKVSVANTAQHQLFMVTKRTFERTFDQESSKNTSLREGDILLTLNDRLITRISELDVMYNHEFLDATIVRDCKELKLKLPTVAADDHETDRAVSFCGAVLHRPHHGVRQQISKLFSEVYVSARSRGSPSYQYGLAPTNFITHVNGKPTPDLDTFLAAVKMIPDNTYFRLKAVTFDSVPWVVTMKKNEHYFPTVEWIKDKTETCGWRRVTYEGGGKTVAGEPAEGVVVPAGEDNGDISIAEAATAAITE